MDKTFSVRSVDGSMMQLPGLEVPVPGLALVKHECQCECSLYALLHIRSGAAVMYAHSPEVFGEPQWERLRTCDWTQTAEDLDRDPQLNEAIAATVVISKGVYMGSAKAQMDLGDVDPPAPRI